MEMENINGILEGKGYPVYTKKISNKARIYIINNVIYKSREEDYPKDEYVTDNEINDILNKYDNIVVQKDNTIHVYCKEERYIDVYKNDIKWLKEIYSNIEEKIVFNK